MARTGSKASQAARAALCIAAIPVLVPSASQAAEYAFSSYALGFGLPMAGYVPGPGVYFSDTLSAYKGNIGGDINVPVGRNVALGLEVQIIAHIASLTWVTDAKILGGSLGFAVVGGYGNVRATAEAAFTGPLGVNRQLNISDKVSAPGDTAVAAFLGWTEGNHHWNIAATGFIPTGFNDPDRIALVGLNRPGVDVKGAYTYLDPKVGTEFSGAVGVTFNHINWITEYQTGAEFHAEGAIIQHIPTGTKTGVTEFQLGVGGYFYQQITDDSSPTNLLGPFRGRTVAIGPMAGYTFMAGEIPITVNARWFREFNVENRFKGDQGYLTATLPLQVYAAQAAAAKKAAEMVHKAPGAAYAPPSWTGFYVGLNAGGVWSNSDITWTTNTFGLVPGHREAIDAAGTGSIDSSGFTGGGQVGFNYQMHHLVVGLEADFNYTGLSGSRSATAIPPIGPAEPITETFNSNFMATFRGRIGITAGPWLAYATVGAASAHVNYGDNIVFPLLRSSNGASANYIAAGWVVGGGVEWMLSPNWSVKAEYLHIDLGHKFNRSLNTAPPFIIPIIGHDHALVEDVARVGINYRFGPSNTVTAKY